ncbi:MAG: metabolite traffic protein EboE [Verrucomicrobiota bacterium]
MQLSHGLHLAYCTNIHRGESWNEVLTNLNTHVLDVRQQVCPNQPYAIGLRLGAAAAAELSQPNQLHTFKDWLQQHNAYVFTINGFPHGTFHGTRVKEQVYAPDWTQPARLQYTKQLFHILSKILPESVEGGVSTVPGSFKAFIHSDTQIDAITQQLWECVDFLHQLQQETGHTLHLDLEPEPLCLVETTAEVVQLFDRLHAKRPNDNRLLTHLRVNYDTCHLAVEFEDAKQALKTLENHGIRIGKLHLSSALKVRPTPHTLPALQQFTDPVYLHQTVVRKPNGSLTRYADLPEALAHAATTTVDNEEWRIHYHIPLHAAPNQLWNTTTDHLLDVLDWLSSNPAACQHLEMETYTWEVLPNVLATRNVVQQLTAEYQWTLQQLAQRKLAP